MLQRSADGELLWWTWSGADDRDGVAALDRRGAANDSAPREARADHLTRHDSAARELDSGEHITINNPWPIHQTRD